MKDKTLLRDSEFSQSTKRPDGPHEELMMRGGNRMTAGNVATKMSEITRSVKAPSGAASPQRDSSSHPP